jgi:uncharacterized protein YecT (DUF1311 family)
MRQSRAEPRQQRRLCKRDRRLRFCDQASVARRFPDQSRRCLPGDEELRPCDCGLRCGAEAGPEIPTCLQQPRRGLGAEGRSRARDAGLCGAVRLDPTASKAADNYKQVSLEVERLNSLNGQNVLPSFNCAVAKLQVEKAICADSQLARLDRDMNDAFLKAIASTGSGSHSAALNLTRQQYAFIRERNAQFGRPGWRSGWIASIPLPANSD